jgi:hypothetical protein
MDLFGGKRNIHLQIEQMFAYGIILALIGSLMV